ncbi:exopolysaccharide biosynthesis polyprenyl glycosylphosphotransferase [Rippkaea orientalis PCC 8801]|uniref:Exopolysaccharide biosynthesis polyprenyl glycosylphosphotransferase n=1 Tax=Rippkaea orientalis (strain PCC 8801 / RF-1) TaxID=41431 RepID=B7JZC4_RIPO1|nr:sugar transferase [Rippkaea orientalis]ACK67335.1 exopolysaccharide biosynthesis polyprenyl glycosylphosphotransferase [Rippkaea orientalis PCC 8801]
MKNLPSHTQQLLPDIRAPHPLNWLTLANQQRYRILILILSDLIALAGAWLIARYWNQFYSPIPPELDWWNWLGLPSLFWIFGAVTLIFFGYGGLYSASLRNQNYIRSAKIISLVYLLSLVVSYFYDPKLDPPRSLFFTAWVSSVVMVLGFRLLITLIFGQIYTKQKEVSVFVIASASRLKKLSQILQKRSCYKIVGAALASTANSPATLRAILQSEAVEVLAEDLPQTALASTLYWNLRRAGVALRLLPSSREILYRRGVPEIFAGLPTLRVQTSSMVGWDYRVKRGLDCLGALIGIILLSPLFLGVAILIQLSSPGSVFFCQERIGLHGKVFQMWKFRTMVPNAAQLQAQLEAQNESGDGVLFKIKNDPRIIRFGHFLRKSSIDELPQLFNVLIGQMSLVGPRPLPLRDVERFEEWHHIRHQVLPGITGLWQISGRSDIEDFSDAARLDLYYIDNWSLNLDLDILVETVRIVLFGKGAY